MSAYVFKILGADRKERLVPMYHQGDFTSMIAFVEELRASPIPSRFDGDILEITGPGAPKIEPEPPPKPAPKRRTRRKTK